MKRIIALVIACIMLTGCYINDNVRSNEVAVKTDGGQILECVQPGIQTDLGFFRELHRVPAGAMTFVVSDKSVATKDTQLVGVDVTIQIKRKTDCASVKNLLTNWSNIAVDDNALKSVAENIVTQGIKTGVRDFTLNQLLDDRDGLANTIQKNLVSETSKFSVEVIAVGVKNVALDPDYEKILRDQANLNAETTKELRRQDLIKQQGLNGQLQKEQDRLVYEKQLLTEQAKTSVDVEIARREGQKTAAANEVYRLNPQAFALEQLKLAKEVFAGKTVYFVPSNSNVMTFLQGLFGGDGVPVPVPTVK